MRFSQRGWPAALFALALVAAPVLSRAQSTVEYKPFAKGVAQFKGVIDTRLGEQITRVRLGGNIGYPENPPIYLNETSDAPPTQVVPGGLLAEGRTFGRRFFPGIDQDRWSPPDCTVAVGPNHVVATVNMKISFHDKATGTRTFLRWLGNQEAEGFFRTVGARDFTFDPKCLYDRNSGRFFVICPEYYGGTRESWMCIGVSDDSDPNGIWYIWRINTRATVGGIDCWLDYPGMGVDNDTLFFCGNMFGFSSGFGGTLVRTLPKAPLLNNGTATWTDFTPGGGSIQCAQTVGASNASFLINQNSTTSMRILAITDPLSNPTLRSTTVSVPSFSNPNSGAPNRGGGTIDTLDGRIMNAWFQNGRLIAGHAVRTSSSGNRTVGRWYDFDTRGWPQTGNPPTLVQSGNVDSGGTYYQLFPAVAFNDFMDMGMVIGRSNSSEYAGVFTTGRKATDPAGTMGALTLAREGSAGASGRWGDYFGAQVDPVDGLTFWGIGEMQASTGWTTWITSWRVADYVTLNVRGVLDGTGQVNVPVTCTVDGRGNGNGTTPFDRAYYKDAQVTLEAPQTFNGGNFVGWFSPSGNISLGINTPRISLRLSAPQNLTVRYAP